MKLGYVGKSSVYGNKGVGRGRTGKKRREKIMNYASPKILLKSLSLHGAFPPGGEGVGWGMGE